MDQIIFVIIALVLIAIMIGSLRKGIQSLISFALLGLIATLLLARLPGQGPSAALGLFGGGDEDTAPPQQVMPAFNDFTQTFNPFSSGLIGSQPSPPNGTGMNGTTGVSPTNPPTTTPPTNNNATGTPEMEDSGSGSLGNTNSGSGDSESTGSVRAWW